MDDKTLYATILGIRQPWYVERVVIDSKRTRIDVYVDHEKDIQGKCPECGRFHSIYDHAPERVFRHLDTCQLSTFIHVRIPRVNCPHHGVRQIAQDFGENGTEMTYAFECHVLDVAKECDVDAISRLCRISWDQGWGTMERAVARGRRRKPLAIPARIGIDEKAFSKGQSYQTLIYDLDAKCVEDVVDNRDQKSLEVYYQQFSEAQRAAVEAVAMDMWAPYIAATRAYIPQAQEKIVFDRFHVMKYLVDAVDEVRKREHRELMQQGDDALKHTKYLWVCSKENVPESREAEFAELRQRDLKVCRAWAIKENLRRLWDYRYPKCMRDFFNSWYRWATHSHLPPIAKAAHTLKDHVDNILTFAKHRITNALGESLNAKIEKVKRMACGFRNRMHYKTAILFHCGGLDLYPVAPTTPTIRYRTA